MTRREWAAVPVLAIWLTLCDQLFHVRTETLRYHWHPQVFEQVILVPFTFAIAAACFLHAARFVTGGRRGSLAISVLVVTAAYLASGLVAPRMAAVYGVGLIVLWLARVAWRGEPQLIWLGVAIASGGVVGEAILSAIGEFEYLNPDVLGVPWWLFGLYLHGSLVAVDLVQRLRVAPPSTGSMTPDKKLAAGDSRKAAARPNSSGRP